MTRQSRLLKKLFNGFLILFTGFMNYLTYKEKLESLEYFIKNRSAVNVASLSIKLSVSQRTVLRMVEALRQQGINVQYCSRRKVYFI